MEHCLNHSLIHNVSRGDGQGDVQEVQEDDYLRELAQQVEHHVMRRGIPVVGSLGLLGNALSLMVLTKEKLHRSLTKMEISAHIGLMGLAVSDLFFCLLVLLITSLPLQPAYRPGDPLLYCELLLGGAITVFIITSTWLIVVMAAERYLAVCHPLRARRFISLHRTRAYVLALFILCPLCTLPVFLEKHVQKVTCGDGSVLYLVAQASRDSVVVRRVVWALCFDFLPCGALTYFNTCIVWKIHKAKQLRRSMAPYHTAARYHSSSSNVRRFRWDSSNSKVLHDDHSSQAREISMDLRASYPPWEHKSEQQDQADSSGSDGDAQSHVHIPQVPVKPQLLDKRQGGAIVKSSPRFSGSTCSGKTTYPRIKSQSTRRRLSDNALNSVTITLVAVVLAFLILVSPWELLKFSMLYSSSPMDRYKLDIVLTLTNFMQVINFSFNFVLYCLVNRSFRSTLRNIICPRMSPSNCCQTKT